jgi:hypothetical protein
MKPCGRERGGQQKPGNLNLHLNRNFNRNLNRNRNGKLPDIQVRIDGQTGRHSSGQTQ